MRSEVGEIVKAKFVCAHPHFTVGREYNVAEVIVEKESLTPFLFVVYNCDMRCVIGHEIEPGFVLPEGKSTFIQHTGRAV